MAERERIARYFAPLTHGEPGSFSLTDDAAVLTPPAGTSLVVTTDSVIQSIHVLPDATPAQYAQKLMRRNLSDLAAMGAIPWRYTLNLHSPQGLEESWFAEFSAELQREQEHFSVHLVGGDSTVGHGPLHLSMTCFGLLKEAPLRRNNACAGDDIYVSGTLGDAALALGLMQQQQPMDATLAARYHRPEPRLSLGLALHSIASAALDVSDGFCTDLAQICTASGLGAQVQREALPRSAALQSFLDRDLAIWNAVLNGGDDYELCFTAPVSASGAIAALATKLDLPLTRVGSMVSGDEFAVMDEAGQHVKIPQGWECA